MPLPDVDQLLEDAFERPLLPCLMEEPGYSEHPAPGDNTFLPERFLGHKCQIYLIISKNEGWFAATKPPLLI
jgi:hypothetical protein